MTLKVHIAAGLAMVCLSAPAAQAVESPTIGGIGLQYCSVVTGVENTPNLAQAVDWAMGYFGGRIDAGQVPAARGPLTAEPMDAAVAIVSYCTANPKATVLEAIRAQSTKIFATNPAPQAPLVEDLAASSPFDLPASLPRPKPRPAAGAQPARAM